MVLLTLLTAGCGLTAPHRAPAERPRVPSEVLGPIFAGDNGGPPVECRGLSRDRCEGPGQLEDGAVDIPLRDVVRVIVSCISETCDESGGNFRIDVLLEDGITQQIGEGGYGETQEP